MKHETKQKHTPGPWFATDNFEALTPLEYEQVSKHLDALFTRMTKMLEKAKGGAE